MTESPTRQKSPPYPSLPLHVALERAAQLREVAKGFSVPLPSAANAWGYSPTSSSVTSVVGALNQFGLLDEAGAGDGKRVKVSLLGESILMDKRPDSAARSEAIRKAALSPKVFLELWERFQTPDVDSHTLVYELTLGRLQTGKAPFTEAAARDVAIKFVESLRFAGLGSEVSEAAHSADQREEEARSATGLQPDNSPLSTLKNPPNLDAILDEVLDEHRFEERKALDEGSAILSWPRHLSADSAEDMEYWLMGVLRQIKRRSQKKSED
jgi:hypothetical protein